MRALAVGLLLAVLAAGCGQGGAKAPTASPSASGSAMPSTPSTAPTPAACRLPVLLPRPLSDAAANRPFTTAWLDVESGTVTSTGTIDAGNTIPSYDAQLARWVPVPAAWVAPDGRSYAYVEQVGIDPTQRYFNTRVHVLDVASGADRVLVPTGHYQVAGWVDAGILLFPIVQGGPEPGLWLADPVTGVLRQLDAEHPRMYWIAAGDVAWYGDLDRSDPNAPEGPGAANVLVSLDPMTGAERTWLRQPGSRVAVMGAVAGGPVVVQAQDATGRARVLLVSTPGGAGHELWVGAPSAYSGALGLNQPTFDPEYIWFVGAVTPDGSSVHRYTRATGALDELPAKVGLLGGGCVPA